MTAPATHRPPLLAPVPHKFVATWPVGTFIENLAVIADGSFVLSVHNRRQLLRVSRRGRSAVLADLPVSPAGLVAYGEGVLVVAGEVGVSPHGLFAISAAGAVEQKLSVPESLFLNGFTPVSAHAAYTVDSLLGAIIRIDTADWSSRVVLRDERLAKISDEPMLPGANGVKAGEDCLYITNTDRATVLKASLSSNGDVSNLDVIAEELRGDNLAIDEKGRLYIANHIHNTLTRLDLNTGERTAIAGPDQGMPGCSACAFHPADPGALYVTTTGGIIMPLDGIPREAKLVRLEVASQGRPLAQIA